MTNVVGAVTSTVCDGGQNVTIGDQLSEIELSGLEVCHLHWLNFSK